MISQGILGSCPFDGEASYTNNYNSSDCELKTYMDTFFKSGLGLSDTDKTFIRPQTLTNYYSGASTTTGAYLFPLAQKGEFSISNYLTSNGLRSIGSTYWLRSGLSGYNDVIYFIHTDGSFSTNNTVTSSRGVRPAMVLKL